MTTAQTILQQLGGNKFLVMTGAHTLIDGGNYLSMKLRKNQSGANYLRITLNAMDTYKMEFLSLRGMDIKTKAEFDNIYNDQLQSIFTQVTGYYTSL